MSATSSISRSGLCSLSVELLVLVFGLLRHKDILNCSAVITNTISLQYELELAVDGLIRCDSERPLTTSQQLRDLLDRRSRWRTLDWSRMQRIPSGAHTGIFDFSSAGTLVEIENKLNETYDVSEVLLKVLSFHENGEPMAENIYQIDTGTTNDGEVIKIHHVITQPQNDLVLLVEEARMDTVPASDDEYNGSDFELDESLEPVPIRIHLRSFSSGGREPHPKCCRSVIEYDLLSCDGEPEVCKISLEWDVIGAIVGSGDQDLVLWSAYTGGKLAELPLTAGNYEAFDFSFVSSTCFIAVSSTLKSNVFIDSIDIFTFGPGAAGIVWPPSARKKRTTLRLVASLCLPQRAANQPGLELDLTTGRFSDEPPAGFNTPFITASDSHIYAVRARASDDSDAPGLGIVVHRNTILSHLAKHLSPPVPTTRRFIPWEEWGPQNTRCFRVGSMSRECNQFVHGERVVWPIQDDTGRLVVEVMDFNTRGKYRATESSESRGVPTSSTSHLVTESSSIYIPECFERPIISQLPYYTIPLADAAPGEMFALNEQGLLRAKMSEHRDVRKMEVFSI
ncbi:hypothetical protein DENSPDRAFT_851586 [Dentipellis sp. KUC8613]|nr:hypothetical protein DENSPDRAFT_851586 [Dentipellis sp. KUC8613]